MTSITMKLSEDLDRRLKRRAAEHGRSVEDEARDLLGSMLAEPPVIENLYAAIRSDVEPLGGIELDLPPRERIRPIPDFSGPEYDTFDDE